MTKAKTKAPAKNGSQLPALFGESHPPSADIRSRWSQDKCAGRDNFNQEDLGVAFLDIVQDLSPIVKHNRPEYNPEARAGMIQNTLDGRITNGPLAFVPAHYRKVVVEWAPRGSNNGPVAEHPPSILATLSRNDKGKFVRGQNTFELTAYWDGVAVYPDGSFGHVKIAMSGTKLSASKKLATMANADQDAPLWGYMYELGTIHQTNSRGDFYNWSIGRSAITPEPYYSEAKGCHGDVAKWVETQQSEKKPRQAATLPMMTLRFNY